MIGCDCNSGYDYRLVGYLRLVTCRTERACGCCLRTIRPLDAMYMQPRYDMERYVPAGFMFLCEECGDLSLSIQAAGYCVSFEPGCGVREDWLDYLRQYEPNNPALRWKG